PHPLRARPASGRAALDQALHVVLSRRRRVPRGCHEPHLERLRGGGRPALDRGHRRLQRARRNQDRRARDARQAPGDLGRAVRTSRWPNFTRWQSHPASDSSTTPASITSAPGALSRTFCLSPKTNIPIPIASRISTCFTASTYDDSVSRYALPWVTVVSAAKSPKLTKAFQ